MRDLKVFYGEAPVFGGLGARAQDLLCLRDVAGLSTGVRTAPTIVVS